MVKLLGQLELPSLITLQQQETKRVSPQYLPIGFQTPRTSNGLDRLKQRLTKLNTSPAFKRKIFNKL
jgi:hypothetical protein